MATVLLVRLAGSLLAVAKLRRSCRAVSDRGWLDGLARRRAKLGIGRDVMLASSPFVGVPLVLGWLRPMIVLPESVAGPESHAHVDAVLLHELSHVRRGDYPWNVLMRLAQALYWPHPLAWALGRVTAEMRDRACDDLCVHEMGGPAAYREPLLAMAGGLACRPFPSLGLAMARRSRLGGRLDRIGHSPGAERCRPAWPARLAIAATAIAIAAGLGTLRLLPAEARAEAGGEPLKIATEAAAVPAGRVFYLQGVAADTGEPVPDADVRIWIALRDEWRKTDDRGRLEIRHSTGPFDRGFGVDVWGQGRAMQRHNWGQVPSKPVPDGETIRLQRGETLGGLIRDDDGRPIAGATVYLWSHNYKTKDSHELLYDLRATSGADGSWTTSGAPETTGELLGFHVVHSNFLSFRDYIHKEIIPKISDLRVGKAVTVLKKGVPIEGRVIDADGRPVAGAHVVSTDRQDALSVGVDEFAVATDADGRFRTGQVGPGEWFLLAQAKGHAPGERRVKIGTAVPQVEITLGRPHTFRGRVVGPAGKPIAGAFVNPDTWRGYRCLGAFLWTDDDGQFRWDDAADDPLRVNVSRQGYLGLFMQEVKPTGEDVVFTLRPSLSIQGTVRDAETRKRVDKATVESGPVDPETGEVAKWTGTPELGLATGVCDPTPDVVGPGCDPTPDVVGPARRRGPGQSAVTDAGHRGPQPRPGGQRNPAWSAGQLLPCKARPRPGNVTVLTCPWAPRRAIMAPVLSTPGGFGTPRRRVVRLRVRTDRSISWEVGMR